jgi:transposase
MIGATAATLMPSVEAIRALLFGAERIHADDTTVPVLAKGKTRAGRLWTYVWSAPLTVDSLQVGN